MEPGRDLRVSTSRTSETLPMFGSMMDPKSTPRPRVRIEFPGTRSSDSHRRVLSEITGSDIPVGHTASFADIATPVAP